MYRPYTEGISILLTLLAILSLTPLTYSENLSGEKFDEDKFRHADSLITEYILEEEYSLAIEAIENQVKWLIENEVYDSLYRYTYNIGRAWWRASSAKEGVARSEWLVDLFIDKTTIVSRHLKVLVDLSWIYSETGNVSQAFTIDSLYVVLMEESDELSASERYTGYYNLAFGYYSLGQMNLAKEHFQKALDEILHEPVNQQILDRTIDVYNALGAMYYRTGDLTAAAEILTLCVERIESGREIINESFYYSAKANALGNYSIILQDLGDLIGSLETLERTIMLRKRALALVSGGYEYDQINNLQMSSYRNLAAIYSEIGDFNRAHQILEYVLEFRQKTLAPDDPRIFSTLEAFISIYLNKKDFVSALEAGTTYLNSCLENFGQNSYFTAGGMERLGEIYLAKGDSDAAVEMFTEALQIFKISQQGELTSEQAGVLRKRHKAYLALQNFVLAKADLLETFRIYSITRVDDDPVFGGLHLSLAHLYFETGDMESSRKEALKALDIFNQFLEGIEGRNQHRLGNHAMDLPDVYFLLARLKLQDSIQAEARVEANTKLTMAIDLIKNAEHLLEGEEAKMNFYDSYVNIFNLALDNCYELFKLTQDPFYIDEFFRLSEENKTIVLRNRLNWFSSIRFSGIPDSISARERKLNGLLTGRIPIPDNITDIYDLEKEYNDLIIMIREEYPVYFSMKHSNIVPSLADFRKAVAEQGKGALVFSQTDQFLYCLILCGENTRLKRLDYDPVTNALPAYISTLTSPSVRDYFPHGREMYQLVFEPFKDYICNERLLIVPDKDMFSVNFDALIKGGRFSDPEYLIYNYTFSYQMSATTKMQFKDIRKTPENPMVAFAPGFGKEIKDSYLARVQDSVLKDNLFLSQLPQPFAKQSAMALESAFRAKTYTGSDAILRNFLDYAGKYGIIHFGTHAEINNHSPLLSRLILSKDLSEVDNPLDGYLHVYDIYNIELNAELAVLMACETGEGRRSSSEGIVSLAHSFSYAGCPGVVMAMWKIDEWTSTELIQDFYHHLLKNGEPKDVALRLAKIKHLQNSPAELKSPFYWAGMILVGDSTPLSIEKGGNFQWFYAMAVVLGFLLIARVSRSVFLAGKS